MIAERQSASLLSTTAVLLCVALFALLCIVGMTFWLAERAQQNFVAIIGAREARVATVDLQNALQAAESNQRGYLLTGNQIYLAPYATARTRADRQVEQVKAVLRGYRETAAAVDRFSQILAERFQEMDRTIALKREGQDEQALDVFRTNRGKALTDEANVVFSGAIRAADNRLLEAVREHRENALWLRWFSILGGTVIVGVVGAAAFAGASYASTLRRARDEVAALNADLESRVAARTAELALANQEVQRFAYIVTHDLKSPLVNIMGFTGELETSLGSFEALVERAEAALGRDDPVVSEAIAARADVPEALGFIRASTTKMEGLINAILKISREGRRALRPEPVSLREVLRSSAAAVGHQAQDAKAAIDLPEGDEVIESDRLALEQIFGNLLDNAIKYRSADRPLKVDVALRRTGDGRIRVDVADNGRGIAAEDLDRVFDLFRRSGAQDTPGEGIGLSYARTIARKLKGDISVRSQLGAGTTFSVVLPLHPRWEPGDVLEEPAG